MDEQDLEKMSDLELLRVFMYASVEREEALRLEIYALRQTMEAYANPKPSADAPLDQIVKDLMNDPIVKNIVHHEFDEVRNQIDALIQEGSLKKLLYSMPSKGPIN